MFAQGTDQEQVSNKSSGNGALTDLAAGAQREQSLWDSYREVETDDILEVSLLLFCMVKALKCVMMWC